MQHAELLDKINQLNILRESNATLRGDSEANRKRAAQLEDRVHQLTAELEPLREQIRVTQADVQARMQHIKLLEDDNQRWKARTAAILQKVGFVRRLRSSFLQFACSMNGRIPRSYKRSRTKRRDFRVR